MMAFRRRVPQRPRWTSRSRGERAVRLRAGDIFVVPRGTEHKPSSDGGAILMFEPSGTVATGDRHEGEIPGHVDSTAGHDLTGLQ
jgi:mannose-6-phosphate isomerase-like protein (cupin superfamily)